MLIEHITSIVDMFFHVLKYYCQAEIARTVTQSKGFELRVAALSPSVNLQNTPRIIEYHLEIRY